MSGIQQDLEIAERIVRGAMDRGRTDVRKLVENIDAPDAMTVELAKREVASGLDIAVIHLQQAQRRLSDLRTAPAVGVEQLTAIIEQHLHDQALQEVDGTGSKALAEEIIALFQARDAALLIELDAQTVEYLKGSNAPKAPTWQKKAMGHAFAGCMKAGQIVRKAFGVRNGIELPLAAPGKEVA